MVYKQNCVWFKEVKTPVGKVAFEDIRSIEYSRPVQKAHASDGSVQYWPSPEVTCKITKKDGQVIYMEVIR